MKKKDRILKNINANKSLLKSIEAVKYYDVENFYSTAETYLKAIKTGRMICNIESVSASGMSRVITFLSCEKSRNGFMYRNYFAFFKALGYSQAKNSDGFRISGCGMDMVFNTNYNICRDLCHLGFINLKQCKVLEQQKPTVI